MMDEKKPKPTARKDTGCILLDVTDEAVAVYETMQGRHDEAAVPGVTPLAQSCPEYADLEKQADDIYHELLDQYDPEHNNIDLWDILGYYDEMKELCGVQMYLLGRAFALKDRPAVELVHTASQIHTPAEAIYFAMVYPNVRTAIPDYAQNMNIKGEKYWDLSIRSKAAYSSFVTKHDLQFSDNLLLKLIRVLERQSQIGAVQMFEYGQKFAKQEP